MEIPRILIAPWCPKLTQNKERHQNVSKSISFRLTINVSQRQASPAILFLVSSKDERRQSVQTAAKGRGKQHASNSDTPAHESPQAKHRRPPAIRGESPEFDEEYTSHEQIHPTIEPTRSLVSILSCNWTLVEHVLIDVAAYQDKTSDAFYDELIG
eukprot:1136313-Pelagomonas_calceolata.AAC.11